MKTPDRDEIASEFHVLDEDYDADDFYGGAFEGSHSFADVVVLHLYSIVPGEGSETDALRIETRHHVAGQVVEHNREKRRLTDGLTVGETGPSLEEFCRNHHREGAYEELRSLVESLDDSR